MPRSFFLLLFAAGLGHLLFPASFIQSHLVTQVSIMPFTMSLISHSLFSPCYLPRHPTYNYVNKLSLKIISNLWISPDLHDLQSGCYTFGTILTQYIPTGLLER